MHRVLQRQLRKLALDKQAAPNMASWKEFLQQVDATYKDGDQDRYLNEQAMAVSTREMRSLLRQLEERNSELMAEIERHAATAAQLEHTARHDQLTNLPNRRVLTEHLVESLSGGRGGDVAVLFVDLDDFKLINDSLGHEVGDDVLVEASRRLNRAVADARCRRSLVVRIGGDEFVILIAEMDGPSACVRVADLICNALSKPFKIAGNELALSASIGLAFGSAGSDPGAIMRDADTAMYRAKMSGKGRYTIFDQHMHTEAVRRLKLEQELRWSIEHSRFTVCYQPIVSLETGRIEGIEALLRWNHPTRGILRPEEFMRVAESTGQIVALGEFVTREVLADLRAWRDQDASLVEGISVGINVSKRQIIEPSFIEVFERAVCDSGVDHESIVLEISESTISTDSAKVISVLERLRGRGVRVFMDDFGTGGSSLSMLNDVPLDAVKIDLSFTHRISQSRDHAAITMAIVSLAHNIGLGIVAEGIETPDQLEHLQACRCEHGQGYFFSKPLNAAGMWDLLGQATKPWLVRAAA